ncbi:DUF4236 domain-containing protein [Desulfosporosinus youngiae]|uniref:DUF4236 domain-containing protein n=1 Tax=Desulfosporosinus youngiae DSM 17734 TaxID=768710 RepID=H5Y577_9FIRM|nr:DUF4236 domain-containing protein [Desulfosporosinus youngiae]EHQ90181.1 hypothetical protein DesyoDRAFT_3147 [Desulfosporosinus youngiae DSM 17734]
MSGWNFRKSQKLIGGLRLNYSSKGGLGISAGVKGARVSVNQKEVRTTLSIPGTGIIKQDRHTLNPKMRAKKVNRSKKVEQQIAPVVNDSSLKYGQFLLSDYQSNNESIDEYIGCKGSIEIQEDSIIFNGEINEYGLSDGFSYQGIHWTETAVSYDHEPCLVKVGFIQKLTQTKLVLYFKCNKETAIATHRKLKEIIEKRNKKSCFVATTVYGDPNCLPVMKLRNWRDSFLAKTNFGKWFIKVYYQKGFIWADFVGKHKILKGVIKKSLNIFTYFLP